MTRFFFALIGIIGFVAQAIAEDMTMPNTIPPKLTGATAAEGPGGVVFLHLITTRTVQEERVRVVTRDGEKVEEKYSVQKPVFESRSVQAGSENVAVFNREGKEVEPKQLLALLKNPTPVAITEDGKLDAFYRPMFREDVLVIALPGFSSEPLGRPAGVPLAPGRAVRIQRVMPAPAAPPAK
jgi:hypothetical protein